ncbi:hypothetical protein [uncultured Gemmiger sp.]|nr:hypothetical protein [uncultured Gemmiger sp.]
MPTGNTTAVCGILWHKPESEVCAMNVVVIRCPKALRWLLRVTFKV